MLIGASLLIIIIIVIFNIVLGSDFIQEISSISIDNEAIIDGVSNTFVVNPTNIIVGIEIGTLIGAIGIITAVYIIAAGVTGITVVSTGLNAQSAKIIILAAGYIAIWSLLSLLAYGLIISIGFFGAIIYVMLTIAYVIGVAQSISGGD